MKSTGRAKVIGNFALSLDLRAATNKKAATGFGSAADKQHLRRLRAGADAVLAGAHTVETDRMGMGVSDPDLVRERLQRGQSEQPLRVVVTNSGQLSPDLPLWTKSFGPIHIFTSETMPGETRDWVSEKATLHLHPGVSLSLSEMLVTLHDEYGVRTVVCEGGPTLMRALVAGDLLDEIFVTFCPFVFGGMEAPALTGADLEFLPNETALELLDLRQEGEEAFLHYRVLRAGGQTHDS